MHGKGRSVPAFLHVQVFLDPWPSSMNRLRFGDAVSSPSNNGDGFAYVNNTIGNLRGRGILCKSSNGVIAHNRMFNLKGFGIIMSPENLWVESDFVSNVLVLNNTVNSYGPGIWLGMAPSVRVNSLCWCSKPVSDCIQDMCLVMAHLANYAHTCGMWESLRGLNASCTLTLSNTGMLA